MGNILAILEVLASHKYVGKALLKRDGLAPKIIREFISFNNVLCSGLLVRGGAVSAVMLSLIETSHSSWNSDPIILSHLTLLNKLSTKGKTPNLSESVPY